MASRLAVLADIHGNFRALEAVLADIRAQQVASVISLGDTIGYGPEPREVVETLLEHGIVSVMGNHELALINPAYYTQLNPTCRESLDISKSLLPPSLLAYLAGLDRVIVRDGARFVHGCPPRSTTVYLYDPPAKRLDRIFLSYPESLCFVGHTHSLDLFCSDNDAGTSRKTARPGITRLDRACRYLLIPGSVGQPRDGIDNKAKYCIWDQDAHSLEIRSVAYDVATTVRLLQERGFPLSNALRLQ